MFQCWNHLKNVQVACEITKTHFLIGALAKCKAPQQHWLWQWKKKKMTVKVMKCDIVFKVSTLYSGPIFTVQTNPSKQMFQFYHTYCAKTTWRILENHVLANSYENKQICACSGHDAVVLMALVRPKDNGNSNHKIYAGHWKYTNRTYNTSPT